jgi:hypothetical protein
LFLYIFEFLNDKKIKSKINDVLKYIFAPRYQENNGDYGWYWDGTKNTYHASSPGWQLPLYDSDKLRPKQNWNYLFVLGKCRILLLSIKRNGLSNV